MVSDQTRREIWQELLDSDRLVRYYAALANRYRRLHASTLLLLAFGAASSFAAVLDVLPSDVQLIANALVGLVAAWVFIADYSKKAAVAHIINSQCLRLDTQWRHLWVEVEHIEEEAARERLVALTNKMKEVVSWSGEAGIVDNSRLNKKSQADAFKTVSERHAVQAERYAVQ